MEKVNKLEKFYTNTKNTLPKEKKTNVIYKTDCENWANKLYYEETGLWLQKE